MADAITRAREAIESRIREIEEEMKRLRGALAELVEGEQRPTRRRDGSGSGRSGLRSRRAGRRRRKVAPRGQRREQLLSHLEQNPSAKPVEIARAMGTTPANAQNVLRKARQDEVVRRRGDGGYELSPAAEPRSQRQGIDRDSRDLAGSTAPPGPVIGNSPRPREIPTREQRP